MRDRLNTRTTRSADRDDHRGAGEITTATDATFDFTATGAIERSVRARQRSIERCMSPKTYTGLEPGSTPSPSLQIGCAGNFVSDTHTWTIVRPGEDLMITPLTPVRFADTRPGWIAADRLFVGTAPCPLAASSRYRSQDAALCLRMRRRWLPT